MPVPPHFLFIFETPMLRTTLLAAVVVTISGCAQTQDWRRPAASGSCEGCEAAKKSTFFQRLGFGWLPGMKREEAVATPVELSPPPAVNGVDIVPEASPKLSIEPAGVAKPRSQAREAKETPGVGKLRKPQTRLCLASHADHA